MKRLNRGFTLIEVLVVVSILGVLAGLISVLVVAAARKQDESKTEQVIQQVKLKLERFTQELHKPAPMTVAELNAFGKAWNGLAISGNTTNECSECLYVALHHPDFSGKLGDELPCPFGNTDDGDIWNKIPEGCSAVEAMEVCDAWGSPIVYISKNHYGEVLRIRNHLGNDVDVHAVKKPSGDYYNATSFQLISLGKDGIQNEEADSDDQHNFTREDK